MIQFGLWIMEISDESSANMIKVNSIKKTQQII